MQLSVIIPVYGVEATLDRCVESVLAQAIEGMEVILVDDGSPDRCPEMCDEWARREPHIRVIHKQNGGLSDARNAGIEAAQGEYITFVDSDDYLAPGTFEPVIGTLRQHPGTDMVEYPIYWHFGSRQQEVLSFGSAAYDDWKEYWIGAQAYRHSFACNKVFRKTLFDEVRFPKGKVFEDMGTLPRLLRKCGCVRTIDEGLYYYCFNERGITATAGGKELSMLLDNHLKVIGEVCDTCYYLHVANIQTDVCRLLHTHPVLPHFPVRVMASGLTLRQRLKALFIKLFGIRMLIKIYTLKK
jgi:glycosyltransferase involved in cell wall biosynthesis